MNDQLQTTSAEIKTTNDVARDYVRLTALKKEIESRLINYRQQLLNTTRELGVLTLKTEHYTISRVSSGSPKMIDMVATVKSLRSKNIPIPIETTIRTDKIASLIEFLRDANMSEYIVEQPIQSYVESTASQLVKDGEQIDGMLLSETEYVRVTPAKKDAKTNPTN